MTQQDLIIKNEQNKKYTAKSQITLLMSDMTYYQVEQHSWGKPPSLKPTHTVSEQDIIKMVLNGGVYITNIDMLFATI